MAGYLHWMDWIVWTKKQMALNIINNNRGLSTLNMWLLREFLCKYKKTKTEEINFNKISIIEAITDFILDFHYEHLTFTVKSQDVKLRYFEENKMFFCYLFVGFHFLPSVSCSWMTRTLHPVQHPQAVYDTSDQE